MSGRLMMLIGRVRVGQGVGLTEKWFVAETYEAYDKTFCDQNHK